MNTVKRGYIIRPYISILVLAGWVALIIGVSINAFPDEATRFPTHSGTTAAAMRSETIAMAYHENAETNSALLEKNESNPAKWTIMIYIAADDSRLEGAAIDDFMEMAQIGSNEAVNIVVQLDRISGGDHSYDDWTDCHRFLLTHELTPADGNEIMSIGEVNMGDPSTLVNFVEWAASNYPAEKYALIFSGHGKGWEGSCWDETSDDDNISLAEMHSALSDISEFIGQPVNLVGFDACLMGTIEVAYELHEYASTMVASEQMEPASGWPYDTILAQLTATPDMDAVALATIIVDDYYEARAQAGYSMTAVDLTKVGAIVNNLNTLAQALCIGNETDIKAVKDYARTVTGTIDEAVIYERHGTNWPGSHGLAIYFPGCQEAFDSAYSTGNVSLADDTSWEEFVISYYSYNSDSRITSAQTDSQRYFLGNVDLYGFCQDIADSEL